MRVSTTFPDPSGKSFDRPGFRTSVVLILIALACGPTPRPTRAMIPQCEGCTPRTTVANGAAILSLNALTWSYDRFVVDAYWTRVSPGSWLENIKRGLVWDGNRLTSNQLMHPLQGSFYYNVSRSRGSGYWGAMAGAAFGSFVWEYFGEIHPPAPNDLVSTTVGGAALGETMHRLSQVLAGRSGHTSPLRRIAAGIMNPVGAGAGALGVRRNGSSDLPDRVDVSVAAGFDRSLGDSPNGISRPRPTLDIGVRYGHAVGDQVHRPWDVFQFRIRLGRGISSGRPYGPENPVDRLESRGALTTAILTTDRMSIGVYQHIDYLRSPGSEFGAQSITAAIEGERRLGGRVHWSGALHVGVMVLGSSPSRLVEEPKRTNDYGPGAVVKIDTRLSAGRTDLLRIEARGHWLRDIAGTHADHLVMLVAGEARVPIAAGFGVGAAVEICGHATFDDQPRERGTLSATSRFTITWSSTL